MTTDMKDRLEEWRSWSDEMRARDWLSKNLRRARYARLSDAELLRRLARLSGDDDRVALLDVLCDRVEAADDTLLQLVAQAVTRMAHSFPGPGIKASATDHAIQRLLPRLPQPTGAALVVACLRSPRRRRLAAAWKFYRRQGFDDEARGLLAAAFSEEEHVEYRKLIACDPGLVMRIGPQKVIAVAPSRYWRMRVLEAALAAGSSVGEFRDSHPAEWLWAIARSGSTDELPKVLELLTPGTSADIVNRVLLCVTEIGDANAINEAVEAAEALLDEEAPAEPAPLS